MPSNTINEVILYLRTTVLRDGADLTDGQLLECFVNRREATALEALVRRHGPMVWGVCRRLLDDHHDAEDAFQATFLVLVRKAASIRCGAKVGNWLYGVAHQTALKARATRSKRKSREKPMTDVPEPAVSQKDPWSDLQPLLDEELSRLPDKYRTVLVLCELEGKAVREVARQLGCPQGTVASRLARGRTMLAKRLARHGFAISGGLLAAALARTSESVPPSAMSSTIKTVILVAAGQATAAGAISVKVAALTEGVLKAMLLGKLKMTLTLLLMLGALTLTGGALVKGGLAPRGENEPDSALPQSAKEGRPEQERSKDTSRQPKRKTVEEPAPRKESPELARGSQDKPLPTLAEIWSGKALNACIEEIHAARKRGARGPRIPLYEGLLGKLNVAAGERGWLPRFADEHRLEWPKPLQGATYESERKKIEELLREAVKQPQHGEAAKRTEELKQSIQKVREKLEEHVEDLSPDQFIEAFRYLRSLQRTVETLRQRNPVKDFQSRIPKFTNVAELVEFLTEENLRIAPATPQDKTGYVVLYHLLAAYAAAITENSEKK